MNFLISLMLMKHGIFFFLNLKFLLLFGVRYKRLFTIRRKTVRFKDEHLWNEYKQCRYYVNNLIKKPKKDYYENEINASRTNAKHMWQTLKQIITSKSKSNAVPSELEAKHFKEYFSTIRNNINAHFGSDITFPSLNIFAESSFEFITSNVDFVRKKLNKLKNNTVLDVLDLDRRILSIAAPIISYSLCHIFNLSLNNGIVPYD